MKFCWNNLSPSSSDNMQPDNMPSDSIPDDIQSTNCDADRPYLAGDLEVAGAIDAFVSLEDVAPDADWAEVLAASWGVPYPTSDESSN